MSTGTAERIRQRRVGGKLNQKQAAQRVGISHRQYQRYETGKASPSVEMLDRIARALGTTSAELV